MTKDDIKFWLILLLIYLAAGVMSVVLFVGTLVVAGLAVVGLVALLYSALVSIIA